MTSEQIWIAFGLLGQLVFSARFVVQWLSSERAKKSVTPPMFWYFSIAGAIMLMAYGIHRKDVVIIFGQSTGLLIYARNLQLIMRERKTPASNDEPAESMRRAA